MTNDETSGAEGFSWLLYEQPFVKEGSQTVGDLITETISKMGENIRVSRMARFKVGESDESSAGGTEAADAAS